MPDVYGKIQDALAQKLHGAFAPTPVYFEEMGTTTSQQTGPAPVMDDDYFAQLGDNDESALLTGDYIFVDMVPAGTRTWSRVLSNVSILFDIAYYKQGATNREYRANAEVIDKLVRPVFTFEDRAITVHETNVKIIDRVLHVGFTLNFTVSAQPVEDPTLELMGDLEPVIEITTT